MVKQAKKLYKLINYETNTVTWCTDSEEIFHIMDWYDGDRHKVEVYELVDEWI